MEKVF